MEKILTNPMFLVFACITLTSLAGTIGYYWHKMRRDEIEASLKQEMLQRGMSADEIVKVLKASRNQRSQVHSGDELPATRAGEPRGE